jgi:hypothetical protein
MPYFGANVRQQDAMVSIITQWYYRGVMILRTTLLLPNTTWLSRV